MEEPRRTEVVHKVVFSEEGSDNESSKLDEINLDDNRAIADYYMVKNNVITEEELEVEKKEKELLEDIKKIVDNKESLVKYLTNLHASIEVMEERIYELELKAEKREKQSIPQRTGGTNLGLALGSLPPGIF
jgi:deoxyadenosine/deoxycytidine kinase